MPAPLLPKLRGHFAEFLDNASSVGLRILSSSTCVGLRYGYSMNHSGFSRQGANRLPYYTFGPRHALAFNMADLPAMPLLRLHGDLPSPAPDHSLRPHSSVIEQCWNLNQLSIGYASRPGLRPRLTQGRSALPWKPWIFGRKDSHLALATHSGILSSIMSTPPCRWRFVLYSMLPYQCIRIPKLRRRV